MQISDLETLDLSEPQEARSAEAQIAGAVDALGARASDPALTALLHGEVREADARLTGIAEAGVTTEAA